MKKDLRQFYATKLTEWKCLEILKMCLVSPFLMLNVFFWHDFYDHCKDMWLVNFMWLVNLNTSIFRFCCFFSKKQLTRKKYKRMVRWFDTVILQKIKKKMQEFSDNYILQMLKLYTEATDVWTVWIVIVHFNQVL